MEPERTVVNVCKYFISQYLFLSLSDLENLIVVLEKLCILLHINSNFKEFKMIGAPS
jgi:hypothetical protein